MGELHLPKGVIFRQERSSVVTVPAKVDVCWVAVVFITERRNSFLTNIGFQGQEFGFRKAFTNLYKKEVVTVSCYHSDLLLIGIVIALAGDVLFDV